jgi:hypothetical protein
MTEVAPRPHSIGTLTAIGFGVGWVLLFAAFFLTFTICSDTTYAKLLFPFAVFADPSLMNRWWLALFVALIQYPFYFGLVALVRARKQSLVVLTVVCLVIAHIAAMAAAGFREETYNKQIWREPQQR